MQEIPPATNYIRMFTLVYTPIALFFAAIILLVFWFGRPTPPLGETETVDTASTQVGVGE
jgi:hypothetical protein